MTVTSMHDYYRRDLYPRILRHLEQFGEVGAWRQMSVISALSHFCDITWVEGGGAEQGAYPSKDELYTYLDSPDNGGGRHCHDWFSDNCSCSFIEHGDIVVGAVINIDMEDCLFTGTIRGFRGLPVPEIARRLELLPEATRVINQEVSALCRKALQEGALGPSSRLPEISAAIWDGLRRAVIETTVQEGHARSIPEAYATRSIHGWVSYVFEQMLQEAIREHDGQCIEGPLPKEEVYAALRSCGLVFVLMDPETERVHAGGVEFIPSVDPPQDTVDGIWVDCYGWRDAFIGIGRDCVCSLPSLYVLRRLALTVSVNLERILRACEMAYEEANKELLVRKIRQITDRAASKAEDK